MVAGRHIWEAARARAQGLAATAAARLSAFAFSPPPVPGAGSPYAAQRLPRDAAAQKLAESKEARYGRLTYGAGPSPARYSSHPATGLTPERVYNAFMQAETTGLCLTKADMTLQILRRDSHLRAVDHTVRTRVSGADWRIKPWDDTALALAVARYVRAWWHDVDSLDRAMYGLLLAGADGYALHEMTDACKRVRFRGVTGETVSVLGDHPRQLDFVHNKHVRFDPLTDAPTIDMGGGKFIDLPRGKIVFHTATGDGLIETRGHVQSTAYLHCITHNAVTRWAIYLAQRGLPNVAYVVDRRAYEDLERRTHYEEFVANIGNGLPTVMTNEGELKITPAGTEAGASGIHAALIGWGNNEKSKVVQGEQLTTEVGGNGAGYNTSETQAQTQDTWVRAIGRALAQDMRTGLVIPVLEKNAEQLEAALGAPIDEIVRVAPLLIPHTQRPQSPVTMVQVLSSARNELGLEVGAEEVRELLGLNPPREGDELPGRLVTVAKGAAVVPSADAQDGPIKNLDEAAAAGKARPDGAMAAFAAPDRADDPVVMVAWYPPENLARELALPGGEAAEELHVTLAYLGRRSGLPLPVEDLATVVMRAASDVRPLSGRLGGAGRFAASETSDGKDVLYASVDVPGLAELRTHMVARLERAGAEVRRSHDFTPHLTLLYLDPAADAPIARLAARPIEINDLWLVVGTDRRRFPLLSEEDDERSS